MNPLLRGKPLGRLLMLLAITLCGCTRPADEKTASVDSSPPEAARIELVTAGDPPQGVIDVVGLSPAALVAISKLDEPERARVLRVYVADLDDPPSVLGSTSIEDHTLRFTPRYPLEPGVGYRAVFRPGGALGSDQGQELTADLEIARPQAAAPTAITAIYPTADALPENQLKFYIHFSAPMSRGEAYRHIHLFDATGKEVEDAFLELGEELWDRDQRRFTLLCDPGRVKRGLKPREELGPVLREGQRYTLVVGRAWRDAGRNELAGPASRTFDVLAPDDTPIDTARWKLEPPPAGGTDPLVVRFGEPLDHSLASRVLWVVNAAGEKVDGAIVITDHESCWRFTPRAAWSPGEYRLVAETTLEDLAGNAIGRPFEVDEFHPIQKTIETDTVEVPFVIP